MDAQTGQIIPNTGALPGLKAIDVMDVIRYNAAYFAKHKCPNVGERERQQARQDPLFEHTPTGQCVARLVSSYARDIKTHFFGAGVPPLADDPEGGDLPR